MDYSASEQVSLNDIQGKHFDLILAASGFEKKCISSFKKNNFSGQKKAVLAYSGKFSELNRKINDNFFQEENFEFIYLAGNDPVPLITYLSKYLNSCGKDAIDILVDFSCMTKAWYIALLNAINELDNQLTAISLFFYYTPAEYYIPKKKKTGKTAKSIIHSSEVKLKSEKPVAVIIGLGLDEEKAEFILKSLNPTQIILMYPDPAFDKRYVETVLRNNRKIIDKIEIRNFLNYPINNLNLIFELLNNLCLVLRLKFNVIIAPVGPKVFTLMSLLMAARYPDIDVWSIPSNSEAPVYEREPLNDQLIYKVSFIKDVDIL